MKKPNETSIPLVLDSYLDNKNRFNYKSCCNTDCSKEVRSLVERGD
jgi:hypothetical protein